jgi:sulfate adenylyltransferase
MISPHGSESLNPLYVADEMQRAALQAEAEQLPSLLLNSAAAANAVMLGAGYFNPLPGYLDLADALSVAETMRTRDGLFWPVPILNLTDDPQVAAGQRIALRDPNVDGHPVLAVMDVAAVDEAGREQLEHIAETVFRTLDPQHPGVATFLSLGSRVVSGPIEVLHFSYFAGRLPGYLPHRGGDPRGDRRRGWKRVVAFQTRNPMHRAHEELCRMAMERSRCRRHSHPHAARQAEARRHPADRFATRRSARWWNCTSREQRHDHRLRLRHALCRAARGGAARLFRQNCGCTHLIVGRDHAGVGDYYGAFDAQTIFDDEVPEGRAGHRDLQGRPHGLLARSSTRWS